MLNHAGNPPCISWTLSGFRAILPERQHHARHPPQGVGLSQGDPGCREHVASHPLCGCWTEERCRGIRNLRDETYRAWCGVQAPGHLPSDRVWITPLNENDPAGQAIDRGSGMGFPVLHGPLCTSSSDPVPFARRGSIRPATSGHLRDAATEDADACRFARPLTPEPTGVPCPPV